MVVVILNVIVIDTVIAEAIAEVADLARVKSYKVWVFEGGYPIYIYIYAHVHTCIRICKCTHICKCTYTCLILPSISGSSLQDLRC